jgi:acetylornithine deacetylase
MRTALDARLAERQHPLLGRATFTVATIRGGTGVNIVPDACAITVDRRTLPAETAASVIAELEAIVADIRAADPSIKVALGTPFATIGGLDTPADDDLVQLAIREARHFGGAAEAIGVPYGTNAAALAERGIPTIVLGPGDIAQAHTADEWVEIEQVERCAELYAQIALGF